MPKLTILAGEPRGATFPLAREAVSLGRESSNEIQLQGHLISRTHATIEPRGDEWILTDLGSRNGTSVNGQRVKTCPLHPGDEIRIGEVTLVFLTEEPVVEASGEADDRQRILTETVMREDAPVLESHIDDQTPDSVQRVNRQFRALIDLTRKVGSARTIPGLMTGAAEAVTASLEPDRVVPILIEEDGSWSPLDLGQPEPEIRAEKLPISRSIVEHAKSRSAAVISRNAGEDRRFQSAASIRLNEIATAICVPILHGQRLLGLLYADRLGEGESFTNDDLEMLQAVALCIAAPLENLRIVQEIHREKRALEREVRHQYSLIGDSPPMETVYRFIDKASSSTACVLITGESGTGKELVARALHYNGPRAGQAFEIVNCAALSHALMDSELFGHIKGAFTDAREDRPGRFELAHKGSIFLDEIGELSEECQSRLLRVLEHGELRRLGDTRDRHVDIRVIAATNRDLRDAMERGKFREDLFYRLNVLSIHLPPLRSRPEDLEKLLDHFVTESGNKCGRPELRLSAEARQALLAYRWPGNVRELRNLVERMVVMSPGPDLRIEDLPAEVRGSPDPLPPALAGAPESLAEVEKLHIMRVLEQTQGNKKEAARVLGIDRSTLYARLKTYGIEA